MKLKAFAFGNRDVSAAAFDQRHSVGEMSCSRYRAAVLWLMIVAGGVSLSAQTEMAAKVGWKNVPAEGWQADLHQLAENAPLLHRNLFHTTKQEEFDAAVARLNEAIPGMSADERLVAFMRLGALIQDGHSGFDIYNLQLPRAPVRFMEFEDGVYVTAVEGAHADIVGSKLVRVGSTDWKTAMEKVRQLVSHDPDNTGRAWSWGAEFYLNAPILLHGLGLSNSDQQASYTVEKNGVSATITLPDSVQPAPFSTRDSILRPIPPNWVTIWPSGTKARLADRNPDRYYWLQVIPERRAVYFDFRAVANDPQISLAEFAKQLSQALESKQVERVVIDVRQNAGGDNTLLRPLLLVLFRARINHRGGVWVLISNRTFSACQNFVNRLENYADVIFVGQPTAENVNFYADAQRLRLQNTHLDIGFSALWWEDKDPRDLRTATLPEIAVTPSFEEMVSGRDGALQIALTEPAPPTLSEVVRAAVLEGPQSLRSAYENYMHDARHRYVKSDEIQLNRTGYELLGQKRTQSAVAVFRLNAEMHPHSSNVFDSLGEGLEADGDLPGAIAAYTKALQIDPTNRHAAFALSQLKAKIGR